MTKATNQIRAKRERRGLSLAELSDMTGIIEQTLQGLEDGTMPYNQTQLEAIAVSMECEPGHLLAPLATPFANQMAEWIDYHAAMEKAREANPNWLEDLGADPVQTKAAEREDQARFDALATPAATVADLLDKMRLYLDSTNPDDGDHPRHSEAMESLQSDLDAIWPGQIPNYDRQFDIEKAA